MKKNLFVRGILISIFLFVCSAVPALAATINWVDWTSATTGSASGTMNYNGTPVSVSYTGEIQWAQTSGGTNWWTETNPSSLPYTGNSVVGNAPPASDIIVLNIGGITDTITFSTPILDPVMAFVSIGQPGYAVNYVFNTTSFTLLSEGQGWWGDGTWSKSGNTLTANEAHGVIQFNGLVTSISWANNPAEYWHGFTVGAADAAPVPEPSTMLLLGSGLVGLVGYGRKQFKK